MRNDSWVFAMLVFVGFALLIFGFCGVLWFCVHWLIGYFWAEHSSLMLSGIVTFLLAVFLGGFRVKING